MTELTDSAATAPSQERVERGAGDRQVRSVRLVPMITNLSPSSLTHGLFAKRRRDHPRLGDHHVKQRWGVGGAQHADVQRADCQRLRVTNLLGVISTIGPGGLSASVSALTSSSMPSAGLDVRRDAETHRYGPVGCVPIIPDATGGTRRGRGARRRRDRRPRGSGR